MTTATALVVPRNGDSSVLQVQDVDVPPPSSGEVQVEVAAAGVNFIDVYQRQGVYPLQTPFGSCSEGAGTVTGPFIAALLVGVVDVAGKYYLPEAGVFLIYVFMIGMLLLRPNGIVPKKGLA